VRFTWGAQLPPAVALIEHCSQKAGNDPMGRPVVRFKFRDEDRVS
jgi:hypothetical protein